MHFPNSLTTQGHANQLFSPNRKQDPTPDLVYATMIEGRITSSFAKAIAIVNKNFGENQAKPDARIINFLVEKKGNKKDWQIKKWLFRSLADESMTEQLFRGMLIEAAHWKDNAVVEEIFMRAERTHKDDERVTTLYIRTLIKCDRIPLAHNLVTRSINRLNSHIQPEILAFHYISNLPDSEGVRAQKIFQIVHNKKQMSPELTAVYSRFIPLEKKFSFFNKARAEGKVTPLLVNHLISSFLAHNLFDDARKLFAIGRKMKQLDVVTWNMIIDMEFRLVGDKQRAHELFIAEDCPIEVITTPMDDIITLDLHDHSYGVNALRVHSFIEANAKEPNLSLITGIGSEEDGNYLKMQNYIAEFVQDYFKGRYATTTDKNNQGVLILTLVDQ